MEGSTKIKIRGYHLDFYGHVNNARYLEFLEEARWDLLENRVDLGKWMKQGISFFVVNINIGYKRPARLGEVIEIHSRMKKFGSRSATLNQRVVLAGTDTVLTDADVTFVLANAAGKAVTIEGDLKKQLEDISPEGSAGNGKQVA